MTAGAREAGLHILGTKDSYSILYILCSVQYIAPHRDVFIIKDVNAYIKLLSHIKTRSGVILSCPFHHILTSDLKAKSTSLRQSKLFFTDINMTHSIQPVSVSHQCSLEEVVEGGEEGARVGYEA